MKELKISFSIVTALCILTKAHGQNLVPNYNFEHFIQCPDTASIGLYANLDSTWYCYASADYFNTCDQTAYFGIPTSIFGFQPPMNGNGYTGILAYLPNYTGGEYLQIKLTNPLTAGQTYYVQYYVNLANISRYAIENMGAMFTDTVFDLQTSSISTWSVPQIENPAGTMLSDTINWTRVSGSFVANGGELYMTLGNFRDESHTVKEYLGGTGSLNLEAYYYIDDVYVATTPAIGINEIKKFEINPQLYPNPSDGNLTLEYDSNEFGELIIYSMTGKVVKTLVLTNGIKTLAIDVQDLQAGMYLYEIRINGKETKTNKLTIIKL
jgi:hypothetical protein